MQRVTSTSRVRLPVWPLARPRGTVRGTLLIAHATGFHGRAYAPLAQELANLEPALRIEAPDLRGHGDADAPVPLSYQWDGFADDVLAVLDQLDLAADGPLWGFGHSMGGAALIRAELRRPGSFAGIVGFEPIVYPPVELDVAGSHLVAAARKRKGSFPSLEAALENYSTKKALAALRPDALEAYVRHGLRDTPDGAVELKLPGEQEAQVFSMSLAHDTFERLTELGCPLIVLHGRIEPGQAAEASPAIAERAPRGRAVAMPDLGHLGPLQDPVAVAREILEAMRR